MNQYIKIIKDKYIKLSQQTKVAFWFTISNILSNGISYLTLPIFTRLLSTEEYGLVTIYNSWSGIATIFITLNLSSGVFLTAYAKNKEKRERIISSFQGLITTIAIAFLCIYLPFQEYFNEWLQLNTTLVIAMVLQSILNASYNMWAMKLKYEFKYKLLVALSTINAFLTPLMAIIMIRQFGNGGFTKILSGVIIQIALYGWVYFRNALRGVAFFDWGFWRYALGFGIPLIPHYLSLVILNQSDRLMINSICGESAAGIYGVGYNISCIINLIFAGINTAYGPWIIQKINDKDYDTIKHKTNGVLAFVLALCLVIVATEPEILKIATTSEYYSAMWVMPSVTIGLFFSYLNNTFARVEFYYEKKYFIAFFSIVSAIVNIVLNYLFIPQYGMIAAGYTTLFSYLLLSILHFILYKLISYKKMNNAQVFDGKMILLMGVLAIGISLLMTVLIDYCVVRYIILFITILAIVVKRDKIISVLRG